MTERSRLSLKKKAEDIQVTERLHKILASSGVASRRSVEDRIARGDVRINGEVAQIGAQISAGDRIQIDDKTLIVKAVPGSYGRVLIYNKPDGEVTSRNDPEGRPTVFEKLPKLRGARWISIGRLDINTQGLLIFTSNGELAHRLSHPTHGFKREYVCRIHGEPGQDVLDRLLAGIELEDGPARFDVIEPMESAGGTNEWFRVEISEGRNREVRRLWEAVGFTVSRLKRSRFGPFSLPKGLHRGELAEMSDEDVEAVCKDIGLTAPPPTLVAEDESARKLRRVKASGGLVVAPGQKRLKAERAYIGYLGGHIIGEEKTAGSRHERKMRHSPDDRFDPRAAKRNAMKGKKGGKGRAGPGRERGPRMALPDYEAQPTFTYDPMTGAFSKSSATLPQAGNLPGGRGRRGAPGAGGEAQPGTGIGAGRRRGRKERGPRPGGGGAIQPALDTTQLFKSEPSYRPPVYSSIIDPETGEVDGNRVLPEGSEAPRAAAGPGAGRERGPGQQRQRGMQGQPRERGQGRERGPAGAPRERAPGRERQPGQLRERPPGPAHSQEVAEPGEGQPAVPNAGAPGAAPGGGKRRRRFRRRRGGGSNAAGAPRGGGSDGAQGSSPPAGAGEPGNSGND